MGMYGLDVKWKFVPKLVREWVTYRTKRMPTLEELNEALDAWIAAREAREGRQPVLRRRRRVRVRHKRHPGPARVVARPRAERRLA